jgi:pimeloyl-ACP methyl ester carboxylesterase
MKRTTIIFCLLEMIAINLVAQKIDNISSVSVDSGYINVDGGKLFYEMAGEGKNIVLLHDGIVNREVWDEQFPILVKNYRVIRYDRRTYGKSSDPDAPYSDIEDLNQLFIQLKIDKAIIFGMSSGGALAIDFTLKYPEKVSGLVLVGAVILLI